MISNATLSTVDGTESNTATQLSTGGPVDTTFTSFPKLPLELCEMMWSYTLSCPEVIDISTHRTCETRLLPSYGSVTNLALGLYRLIFLSRRPSQKYVNQSAIRKMAVSYCSLLGSVSNELARFSIRISGAAPSKLL
jgi:hypothetical protein